MRKLPVFIVCLFILGTTQVGEFVFRKGDQKITVRLDGGKTHLQWNETTQLMIRAENIDPGKLSFSAPGLRLLQGADATTHTSTWQITPKKESIKNDTLKLSLMVRELNDSLWKHHFKIPIK